MVAYCNNNPVVGYDPTGAMACYTFLGDNHIFSDQTLMGGCGGVRGPGIMLDFTPVKKVIDYITNTDEQVVLQAETFAFYKGQLVIKEDWGFTNGRSGSFIIMFLNSNETDPNVVKHERGHLTQLMIMELPNFVFSVAIPSVLSDPYNPDYYSNPWERTADWLGGVNREGGYTAGSLAWGIYQFIVGPVSVPIYLIWGE